MDYIVRRGRTTLSFTDPHLFVRSLAVCAAVGLEMPDQAQMKWLEKQANPLSDPEKGSPDYWLPYAKVGTFVFIEPWAVGAYNYLRGRRSDDILLLEPTVWYRDIIQRVENLTTDHPQELNARAYQAFCNTMPEGAEVNGYADLAKQLEELYGAVRGAQATATLIHDKRKIARRLATVRKSVADRDAAYTRECARFGISSD